MTRPKKEKKKNQAVKICRYHPSGNQPVITPSSVFPATLAFVFLDDLLGRFGELPPSAPPSARCLFASRPAVSCLTGRPFSIARCQKWVCVCVGGGGGGWWLRTSGMMNFVCNDNNPRRCLPIATILCYGQT